MKRWLTTLVVVLFIVLIADSNVLAYEESKTKYFGVGATVEEIEQATFQVKTMGEKSEEGFIYTPVQIKKGKDMTFKVTLQGDGTVFLKLVETDSKGRFINEHTTPMILLTSDWKAYKLPATLNEKTAQIDTLVITGGKQQMNFMFRDVAVE
ncbi:hypothetical protein [Ornithinibacillus californiensis]|uniref:hypothetical protein n=1 Tax=Ornithinibacillus californiensis TaxID=161536 RepID=UPI00064DC35F|nr:hypothetical protein [Ornithinibacillus californiensis]